MVGTPLLYTQENFIISWETSARVHLTAFAIVKSSIIKKHEPNKMLESFMTAIKELEEVNHYKKCTYACK